MRSWGEGDNREKLRREPSEQAVAVSHVRNPQEGKTLTVGKLQVTVKATGAETNGCFGLVEITVPPYFADFWPHLHHTTSEAIYLTQGMLAVTLGEETMVVRQGSFIFVPPQQVHRIWNPAATAATFLTYFAPAGAEDFFEALVALELPVSSDRPSVAAAKEVAKPIRVVLDTSVLLSAERRPLLLLAANGVYTLVWSRYIADELARKMVEMGWSPPKVAALIDALVELAEVVDHRQITGGNYDVWLHDPSDHPIMATALAGRVDYLVTWNTKDFPPKQRLAGIIVLTPDAFLRILGVSV